MPEDAEASIATKETPEVAAPAPAKAPTEADVSNFHRMVSRSQQETAQERQARQALEHTVAGLEEEIEILKRAGDDEGGTALAREMAGKNRELKNRERALKEQEQALQSIARETLVQNLSQRYGVPQDELVGQDVGKMEGYAKDYYIAQLEAKARTPATPPEESPPDPVKAGFDSGEGQVSRKSPQEMTPEQFKAHVDALKRQAATR